MSDAGEVLSAVWGLVMDFKIGSFPVIYAFLAMLVMTILIRFLRGKK